MCFATRCFATGKDDVELPTGERAELFCELLGLFTFAAGKCRVQSGFQRFPLLSFPLNRSEKSESFGRKPRRR